MKHKSGERTLLASVLLSSPGPIVIGAGLLIGHSSTQLADFIRRTAELAAIIVSWIIYRILHKNNNLDAVHGARLKRFANIFVGSAMCLSGAAMMFIALLSSAVDKGNVIPGLAIAVLGVTTNSWFWLRYRKLNREKPDAILAVQSKLYFAKSLVDACVTIALAVIAAAPASPAAYYVDIGGSAIVAVYLIINGIITICSRNAEAGLEDEAIASQREEVKSLAGKSFRELADHGPFSKPELIFSEGTYFRNCHASTVLPFEDGTVLAAYFAGTEEGNPDVGIWLSRRVNGVWQEPVRIAKTEQAPHWNPVLFKTDDGIRIVYKVGHKITEWKSRTMVSYDKGETWSPEVCYPAPNDACGPVRSKPLLMSNGRLLAPNSDETDTQWLPRVDVSDDFGRSFQLLSRIPVNITNPEEPDFIEGKGAIQPTLWESEPGYIHMLLRTTAGYIYRSDSEDYGQTWCRAYKTNLPNNNSGIDVAAHGKDLYLVFNPISGNWAQRTPIVICKSADNGETFEHFLTLEDKATDDITNRSAEFSYPAAVVLGDTLYVTYTYMRRQIAFHEISLNI